ncbi:MAG: hypothetical protein R3F49_05715 [Planctomycetota bacterium]
MHIETPNALPLIALVHLLVTTAATAQADVLVVDALGGGDFTDLQAAVVAASSGDTLLVRSGDYGAFTIHAKALDIAAYEGATVRVFGGSAVQNLNSSHEVVLSGLELRPDLAQWVAPTLGLTANAGRVRLVDCAIFGLDGLGDFDDGGLACAISGTGDVGLFHCRLRGGAGGQGFFCNFTTGGLGLEVSQGQVDLYGSTIEGGPSADTLSNFQLGGHGGPAALVRGAATLRGFSSTFAGANGGEGDLSFTFCACGDGGAGLRAEGASVAELFDCVTTGGQGGITFGGGTCNAGAATSGPVTVLGGAVRALTADRVVRVGGTIQGVVRGAPGDAVFLLMSLNANHQPYPALLGVLNVGAPYVARALAVGVIGPSGVLPLSGGVTGFSPGLTAEHLYIQPFISAPSGRWLGQPDVLMVLAPGI